jgi:hypothetical protein
LVVGAAAASERHSVMQPEDAEPTMFADHAGIHLPAVDGYVVVDWGEIDQVCALRETYADGTPFIEVFIDHISGVDFRLHSVSRGFEQTTAEMEKHLIGFRRASLEAVGTLEEAGETLPVVWKRDEAIQPFELRPPVTDPRDPTPQERVQMEAAHKASIATCEKILGRPLGADELACVQTGFENGRITGNIAPPLAQLLVERQSGE